MTLRLATSGDVPAMAALHAASFPEAWTADSIATLLSSPGAFAFIAGDGFVLARVAAGEAEILSIAVAPHARRHGLGQRLLLAACDQAGGQGAEAVFLEVGAANITARALYDSLGFKQVGHRKAYYGTEDGLVLKAGLPLSGRALGNDGQVD